MLVPVDRVEVTVVIDNFLDVLMAGEEGVLRYAARDLGAAEQLVRLVPRSASDRGGPHRRAYRRPASHRWTVRSAHRANRRSAARRPSGSRSARALFGLEGR